MDVRLPKDVSVARNGVAARWIEIALASAPWATVGALLPDGFEAYVRVLHPARRRSGELVRWVEVASLNGKVAHPLMQFERIAELRDMNAQPTWGERPRIGRLPHDVGSALVNVLRGATTTPGTCWFCIWAGYGGLREQLRSSALVRTPRREYLLLQAPVEVAPTLAMSLRTEGPNIWWPEDHAWCVATEVDLDSTYIAGSSQLVQDVMGDGNLEAAPARITDRVDIGADAINR